MNKSKNPGKTPIPVSAEASTGNIKEFLFKTNKIERILTIIAVIFFILTTINDKNKLLMVAFFAFGTIIILYYIIWFRKKPPYVKISGEDITISRGIFFKTETIHKSMIKEVKSSDTSIEINLMTSRIKIYKLLLSENDAAEITPLISIKK